MWCRHDCWMASTSVWFPCIYYSLLFLRKIQQYHSIVMRCTFMVAWINILCIIRSLEWPRNNLAREVSKVRSGPGGQLGVIIGSGSSVVHGTIKKLQRNAPLPEVDCRSKLMASTILSLYTNSVSVLFFGAINDTFLGIVQLNKLFSPNWRTMMQLQLPESVLSGIGSLSLSSLSLLWEIFWKSMKLLSSRLQGFQKSLRAHSSKWGAGYHTNTLPWGA